MTEPAPRSFSIEAIVESPATADERLRTAEGVRAELVSHFEYLGACVPLMAVREVADDERGDGATEGGRR